MENRNQRKKKGTLKIQIHIAGTKRSGKTTLARKIWAELERQNHHAVIFDIDDVRRTLFGEADKIALIGSPENQRMHREAHEWIFTIGIPNALQDGKISIMVATHSHRALYERAVEISENHSTILKFIMLQTPLLEDTVRRAKTDDLSLSDTVDLENNPAAMEAYLTSTKRFEESYANRDGNYIWIPQGTPKGMTEIAMRYILG